MRPIILIGGGGHCISCIDVIKLNNQYEIIGILDSPDKIGNEISGFKVIGTDDDIPFLASKYENFLITIGQIKSPSIRIKLYDSVKKSKGKLPIIVSPKAYVSESAYIDEGTIIMHNAIINAKAQIGKNCIINTGALIEHEASVGDFCHVSTNATVNGQVIIGKNAFIGSNSVIANNLSVPDEIIIAAGACILKSPAKTGIYIGNPAKRVERK
jgi:sugar O-acyltransferase (sialic acid O-acetyltransferase NeuD family)